MPVNVGRNRGEISSFCNYVFASNYLFYTFYVTIMNFMLLLIKFLPMLLLGVALCISLSLRHFSELFGLLLQSKLFITTLNKILAASVNLADNLWYVSYLIKLRGDIEQNPGPKLSFSQNLISAIIIYIALQLIISSKYHC